MLACVLAITLVAAEHRKLSREESPDTAGFFKSYHTFREEAEDGGRSLFASHHTFREEKHEGGSLFASHHTFREEAQDGGRSLFATHHTFREEPKEFAEPVDDAAGPGGRKLGVRAERDGF